MRFAVYLPDAQQPADEELLGTLFWLSGMVCTEESFIVKSGMQRFASARRTIVVCPDTRPRAVPLPNNDCAALLLDEPAGFYLDATEPGWSRHYRMYSYIVRELVPLCQTRFPVDRARCGIFGHSMGGHGALTIGLRNPDMFASISALAPICNPGRTDADNSFLRHFVAFLGPNRDQWKQYDATEVAKKYAGPRREILIDQGSADRYLPDLRPDRLLAVQNAHLCWKYRQQEQFGHGYFFVHTFVGDHFDFHAQCWAGQSA